MSVNNHYFTYKVDFVISMTFFPCQLQKGWITLWQRVQFHLVSKSTTYPRVSWENYCPLFGLCFLSKLVERVVAQQLKDSHSLNSKTKSRYKAGHCRNSSVECCPLCVGQRWCYGSCSQFVRIFSLSSIMVWYWGLSTLVALFLTPCCFHYALLYTTCICHCQSTQH